MDAHGQMSCTVLEVKTWYVLLAWELEEVVKYEQFLESDGPTFQTKTFSEVQAKAEHYERVPGSKTEPLRAKLPDMSFPECSIYLWCKGSLHLRFLVD